MEAKAGTLAPLRKRGSLDDTIPVERYGDDVIR